MEKPHPNMDDHAHYKTRNNHRRQRRSFSWITILIIAIIIIVLIWHFYSKLTHKKLVMPPIPISVAPAGSANVPVYIPALGSVTSIDTITVRTQVNGQLLQVLYREGQIVKAGQLLAIIDPRPFLAQLIQFQGQLERDQAQLTNARIDLKRYAELYPQGAVSQQTYETQKALVKQLEGTVKFDQGQIDTVKVNLIYTRITSPINGRVGLRLVDPGNFVQTTDTTGLVIINIVQPITVVFSIPEDNVPQVLEQISKGKTLKVEAYDRTQNQLLATGTLLTIDNQIDQTTGTVKLKAQFQNEDYRLFPDQFVNVQLLVTTLPNATIVPSSAIQHGPNGTFVFLLNKDNTVTAKPVVTSVTYGNNTAITSGISPGQFVAVEGGDKLSDGSKVSIINGTKKVSVPDNPLALPQPKIVESLPIPKIPKLPLEEEPIHPLPWPQPQSAIPKLILPSPLKTRSPAVGVAL